jgi:hypothetical protein
MHHAQPQRWSLILLLAVLFMAFAAIQGMAQTQAAATSAAQATAPVEVADFLATLAAPATSDLSGLTPAPALASGCTSNSQCPAGQICCLACGFADCDAHACFAAKTCPHFQ